jgi:hypothetical protein
MARGRLTGIGPRLRTTLQARSLLRRRAEVWKLEGHMYIYTVNFGR